MPQIVIPPWLKSPDVAADYSRGLAIGAQVAESNARLSQEAQRTAMEAQTRAQTLKQEQLQQQTRLQTEAAYKQTQIALQKQRLDEAAKLNDAKVKGAAMKVAAQHKLASLLQGGMSVEQALYQVPELATPGNINAAHRDAMGLGQQRIDLENQRLEAQQQRMDEARNRSVELGETTTTTQDPEGNPVVTKKKNYGPRPGSIPVPGPTTAPAPAGPRQAVGKYKIGTVYKGGLKYLGGEPSDETSWQKVS